MSRLRAAAFAAVPTLALLAVGELLGRSLPPPPPDPGAPPPGQEFMLSVGRLTPGRSRAQVRLGPGGEVSFSNHVVMNRHGTRGPDFEPAKPPGRRRFVSMGDSVAMGYGVSEGMTYADLLRERMAARPESGAWDVVNAGISGFTSAQVLAYWRARVRDWRPDALLVSTCHNDQLDWARLVGDGVPMTDAELIRMYEARRGRWTSALERTGLGRALARAVRPTKNAWRRQWAPEARRRRVPLEEYAENLRALSREMRRDGGRVFWLLSGCQGEYGAAFRAVAAEDGGPLFDVHEWCEPRRAVLLSEEPYKSLADFYRREYGFDHRRFNGDRICTFDGAHLSALGNYVLAERLSAWLAGEEPPNF